MNKIKNFLMPKPKDNVIFYTIKALIRRFSIDNLSQLGGQLAYFAILSLFPFLILINQIISMVNVESSEFLGELYHFLPPNVISIVDTYLSQLRTSNSSGIFTFGALVTIWLASNAVTSLLFSLDKAFRNENALSLPKKLIGYGFTALILVLIFASLIFSSVSESLFMKIVNFFNLGEAWIKIWKVLHLNIPIALSVLMLMFLYNIIAPKGFSKRNLFIGAIFAVGCLMLMGLFLSYYTSNFGNYSVVYGSLGAIIILLLFLYWSGIILVLGGELAHILEMRRIKNYKYDCNIEELEKKS